MNKKQKILIADSREMEAKQLADQLKEYYDIVSVVHDGQEAVENIQKLCPDLVILDVLLPLIDGPGVVEQCRNKFTCAPPLFIIVTCIGSQKLVEFVDPVYIDYCIMRPFHTDLLIHRMEQLTRLSRLNESIQTLSIQNLFGAPDTSSDSEQIKQNVTKLIHSLGVPANIKGYQYLRDAILLSIEDMNCVNYITKLLYPTIAKKHKTTSSSVERAIRHAIDIAWNRGNIKLLDDLFGYNLHSNKGKPTNSEFIALLADKMRLNY